MARDLYGEMLSRALNRGAPPGHFAAYIQPDEAALLRSQGGGVAPGGGQYMANGLPSYQFGAGQGTLNGLGFLGSGGRSAINVAAMPDARRAGGAIAAAPPSAHLSGLGAASYMSSDQIAAAIDAHRAAGALAAPDPNAVAALRSFNQAAQDAVAPQVQQVPEAQQVPARQVDQAPPTQEGNLALIGSNPDYVNADGTLTDAGREAVSGNISDGGLGWLSPGSSLAQNNADATVAQIGHVNQGDASTGGYAIFNPHPQLGQPVVSVPEGMSMGMFGGLIPAAINTAIGMGVPGLGGALIGAGNTLFGHTLGSMARDALAPEGTALGDLLAIPGDIRGRIGEALSPITEGIGDALSGATRGLSGLLPDVTPPTSVPQVTPPGVQPPAPEVVVDEEQIVPGSEAEPFVRSYDDIDPEIARRLAANVLYGEERLRELEELA